MVKNIQYWLLKSEEIFFMGRLFKDSALSEVIIMIISFAKCTF